MADRLPPRAGTIGLWVVIATALFLALEGEGLEKVLFLVTAVLLYLQFGYRNRITELRDAIAATGNDLTLLKARVDQGELNNKDTNSRIALLEAELRTLAEQVQDRRFTAPPVRSESHQSWRFVGAMVAVLCTANVILMGVVTFRYGVSAPLSPDGLSAPLEQHASQTHEAAGEVAPRARWKTEEMQEFVAETP